MINRLVLLFAVLGAFASYASASAEAKPAALGQEAPTPSTLTISVTISPSTSGGQASTETMTITFNPLPDPGPAFSAPPAGGSPEPAVPDVDPPCHSMDALVSSCTTQTSFWGLPLSAQAQCLCNVGPWDAVVAACFSELTVDGQYYASSITSHGLLGLCSSYKAGPTWPASVLASISALDNPGTPAPSTPAPSTPAPVTTGTATAVGTGIPTKSTTSSTVSPLPNAASALVRPSLETWGSLLVSLLPWLFGL